MKVWVISRMFSNEGESIDYEIIGVYKNHRSKKELQNIELNNINENTKISYISQDEFEIED